MIALGGRTRIFLATGVTDLRRGFGLEAVIEHDLGHTPLSGDIYLFANRRRDMLKAFFFDCGFSGPRRQGSGAVVSAPRDPAEIRWGAR